MIAKVKVEKLQVIPAEKEITIIATIPRSGDARRQLIEAAATADQGKPLQFEIKKWRKARSLSANAYAWVLIDKIAAAVRIPKEEVYRNTIRDIGGVSETVCVKDKAVDKLRQGWQKNGIGWQSETMPSKLPGCTNVVLYYGSSMYDTAQMSVFIDRLIDDAKALDIETMPPDRLSALVDSWR